MVFTLRASASSGLAVSFQSDAPAVCTVSRRTVTLLAPGICNLTAHQGGSADYAPAQQPLRFQVFEGKTGQTILFDPLPDATVGVPFTMWATASSGLMVVFGSDTPTVCTVSSRTVIPLATGTCKVTAFQGGSAEYRVRLLVAAAAGRTRLPEHQFPAAAGYDLRPVADADRHHGL